MFFEDITNGTCPSVDFWQHAASARYHASQVSVGFRDFDVDGGRPTVEGYSATLVDEQCVSRLFGPYAAEHNSDLRFPRFVVERQAMPQEDAVNDGEGGARQTTNVSAASNHAENAVVDIGSVAERGHLL